jgi:hypothetical protein
MAEARPSLASQVSYDTSERASMRSQEEAIAYLG